MRKRQAQRDRFADLIVPTLSEPDEVWLQADERQARVRYMPLYFRAFGAIAVAWEQRGGTLGWTFYPAERLNERRKGYLLYRK